jgi:hypothetical protein
MKLLININKTRSRGWPKRVALQMDKPKPARTEFSPRQQDAPTQSTHSLTDQKLLRFYQVMDLAG